MTDIVQDGESVAGKLAATVEHDAGDFQRLFDAAMRARAEAAEAGEVQAASHVPIDQPLPAVTPPAAAPAAGSPDFAAAVAAAVADQLRAAGIGGQAPAAATAREYGPAPTEAGSLARYSSWDPYASPARNRDQLILVTGTETGEDGVARIQGVPLGFAEDGASFHPDQVTAWQ